jgi:MOSC domain-containing protein YiiM
MGRAETRVSDNEPQMPALLVSHKKPGYYFRVLQEGEVEAGDEIVKVADGPERMTVAEIDGMLYLAGHSREQLEPPPTKTLVRFYDNRSN